MKTWVISFLFTFLVTSSRMVVGFEGDPYSNDGCGETRGCFDCRDSVATCEVNVAWEPDPDEGVVKFTLWGDKTGDQAHVSLGITSTANMFNADVYSCISDSNGMVLVRSWNPSAYSRSTTPTALKGVFGQEVTEVDGEIRCQFYRNMSLNDGDSQFLDISGDNSYYLILARGPASGGAIFGHDGSSRGWSGAIVLSEEFDSFSTTQGGMDGHTQEDDGVSSPAMRTVSPTQSAPISGGMDGHTQEDEGVSSPTLPTVSPTQSAPISVRYGAWTLISSLIMALLVNI